MPHPNMGIYDPGAMKFIILTRHWMSSQHITQNVKKMVINLVKPVKLKIGQKPLDTSEVGSGV